MFKPIISSNLVGHTGFNASSASNHKGIDMANNTISSNEASNFDFGSRIDDAFNSDWREGFSNDILNDWDFRRDSKFDILNDSEGDDRRSHGGSSSSSSRGGTTISISSGTSIDSNGNETDFTISTGNSDDILHGGDGDSHLSAGAGNDKLYGGAGNDILTGGEGTDRFCFDASSPFNPANAEVDTITDFSSEGDHIVLFKDMFTALTSTPGEGFSIPSEFAVVGSDTAARTSAADIVYNSVNGNLFYNPNGKAAGFGSGGQFAVLTGDPVLSSTDFVIM